MARSCKNCRHSVLCPSWGELKCLKLCKRIYIPTKSARRCEHFSDGTNDTICQCDTCQENHNEDDE